MTEGNPTSDRPTGGSGSALVVGVVGGSGSGKTTVARAIFERLELDAALLDQDAYYRDLSDLPSEERTRVNFDHPDAFDTDLMVEQIEALRRGEAIEKPSYDFSLHVRTRVRVRVEPRDVLIVDGILLFAEPRLRRLFDIRIFVDVADDLRFIRRLRRDVGERGRTVDGVIAQYLETVRPMHLEFVEPSKRHADIILPEGGHNQVGVEMILARVLMEVAKRRR
jgi:uridine kinase